MYIEVTIKENSNEHKHLVYFPKFNRVKSVEHLKEVYKNNDFSYKLLGSSLKGYTGIK